MSKSEFDLFMSFTVSDVTRGDIAHEGVPSAKTMLVLKLEFEDVMVMKGIIAEYNREYEEGAGPLMLTFTAQKTR